MGHLVEKKHLKINSFFLNQWIIQVFLECLTVKNESEGLKFLDFSEEHTSTVYLLWLCYWQWFAIAGHCSQAGSGHSRQSYCKPSRQMLDLSVSLPQSVSHCDSDTVQPLLDLQSAQWNVITVMQPPPSWTKKGSNQCFGVKWEYVVDTETPSKVQPLLDLQRECTIKPQPPS